jgi:hypothetical protein
LILFYLTFFSSCVYAVINLHRRIDLWGPDGNFLNITQYLSMFTCFLFLCLLRTALKFDPDRFLDERLHKYLVTNPFIFCPFNAGPRICLGQQLAYNKASFFLVRLLQRFAGFNIDSKANIKPPADWATGTGTKPTEKVHPLSHLALYVKVSSPRRFLSCELIQNNVGRALGLHE